MSTVSSGEKAWEVAAKYDPKIRAALEAALTAFSDSVKVTTVQTFIASGDINALQRYLQQNMTAALEPVLKTLNEALIASAFLAEDDINAYLETAGVTLATQIPAAAAGTTQIVLSNPARFGFNPVNPDTINAVRIWQGNLIQQMDEAARKAAMDAVEAGLVRGTGPRTTALAVREGLGLTAHQSKIVANFGAELNRIVGSGIRSATSWGIYTPTQISALKVSNPKLYKQLDFTPKEIANGRRWGKISRAGGTLQVDPATGIKRTLPLGSQSGPNAFRLDANGKPIDAMSAWRLRDKRFDPLIYDAVETRELRTAAQKRLAAVKAELAKPGTTGTAAEAKLLAERAKLEKSVPKLKDREDAALARISEKMDEMKQRYRERWIKHRSEVIARTESLRAANLGQQESWRQAIEDSDLFAPDEVKRYWVSARDDRVRESHRVADGAYTPKSAIPFDKPFTVDGNSVHVPPAGPNCRCSIGYTVGGL